MPVVRTPAYERLERLEGHLIARFNTLPCDTQEAKVILEVLSFVQVLMLEVGYA